MTNQNVKWKNPILWLWVTLSSYIILQIITLGTRSFDGDEGVVLRVISADNWNQFWARIAVDVHPPLYHLLAKFSVSMFGIHEWSLRLPSAAAGGLSIVVGYWLGKKIWHDDRWKPLALGVLLGFSPYLFYYYQEARFYPLLLSGAALTYGALIDMDAGKKILKSISIFVIGALVMVYSQHLGWLILAAELLSIIVARKWRLALLSLPIIAVVILVYSPIANITFSQFTGRLSEQGGLMLADNVKGILGSLYRFGAGRLVLGIEPTAIMKSGIINITLFAISLIVPIILLVYGIKSERNKSWNVLATTLTFVSLVVALFVSEIGGRAARYLIYLWPFYGVLIIDGAAALGHRVAGKAIIAAMILISLLAIGKHLVGENHAASARQIASLLDESAGKDDVVVVKGALAGGEKAALEFYLQKKISIYDYYQNYSPGKLSETLPLASTLINEQLTKHPTLWYYDFTYGEFQKSANWSITEHQMGKDKEGKSVIVYQVKSL